MAGTSAKRDERKNATAEALGIIGTYFEDSARSRQSKHLRVRNAIIDAIVEGHLDVGDQIPPEQDLCAALMVSLGTVQRALRELSMDGTLVREHGRGTFVGNVGLPNEEVLHFRFRMLGDDTPQPVSSIVVEEEVIHESGRWTEVLGEDPAGYLKLVRIVSAACGLNCYNELYFSMTKFGAMREIAIPQLRNINIKTILARQFNTPTLSITQMARAAVAPEAAQAQLGVAAGTVGMDVEIIGHSYGKENIFLQRIWFPESDCYMDLTHEESILITAGGASQQEARMANARIIRAR